MRKQIKISKLVFDQKLKEPIEKIKNSIKSRETNISIEEIKSIANLDDEKIILVKSFPKNEESIINDSFMEIAEAFIKSEPKLLDHNYSSIGIAFSDTSNTKFVIICIILAKFE